MKHQITLVVASKTKKSVTDLCEMLENNNLIDFELLSPSLVVNVTECKEVPNNE